MLWIDNDDLQTAGLREIAEETWYIDVATLQILPWEVHAEYYAWHKGVNRYSIEQCVVYQLKSDLKHNHTLDDQHHTLSWIPYEQVADILSDVPWLNSNLLFWYQYTNQTNMYQSYSACFTPLYADQ